MNGHQQEESSTTSTTTSTLLESLGQVDLTALKRDSPAASHDRLLETARMISALNVGKDLATVKDRDEHEATLTKLLQVSQTIIDCLLARSTPSASESKNDINAYQNNLRQENAKLRKLLSLQQKAIAFRRANLWTVSDNSSNNNSSSSRFEDEDASTSAAVDSVLPEDSNSNANNSNSINKSFLQCIYCPKIFADGNSFAKHLSLRHLSSSIDDVSLLSSITNNSNSFMQRLQSQYQKVLEMKEAVATATSNKSSAPESGSNDATEVINRLQLEIGQLAAKLAATEQALLEERSARASFENDLKQGLAGNVQQLQSELAAKIEEVRSLVMVKRNAGASGGGDSGVAFDAVDATEIVPTKMASEEEDVSIENFVNDVADGDDDDQPLKQEETTETAAPISTASQLKQTLRLQLLSQLTKRPEPSIASAGKVHQQQQQVESPQKVQISESINNSNSSKELTKAEISTSVESRLREYLQQRQQQQEQQLSAEDENENSVTEVENDPPTVLPPAKLNSDQDTSSELNESNFSAAMSKVQRDRELLIQQSRHDYDFVAIESSLRELIDSKLRSKLQAAEETTTVQPVKAEEEEEEEMTDVQHDHQPLPSAPSPPPDDNDHHLQSLSEQHQLVEKQQQQQPEQLKSILKSPRKIGARPKTRRKSFDENGDEQSTVNSNSNNRRITFSEQIIEFPISPRESEGEEEEEDSDDADNDADLGFVVGNVPDSNSSSNSSSGITRRNQMFVIRSLDGGDDYDGGRADQIFSSSSSLRSSRQQQLQQQQSSPLADSFAREKIFINEYSTSSSSSSSEEEEEEEKKVVKIASSSTASSLPAKPASSSNHQEVVVDVEVHQQHQRMPQEDQHLKSTPVPAARRSKPSTLDSLLLGDDSPPPPPSVEPAKAVSPSSTRVQELADLIERKLQQKQQRSAGSSIHGAVDTLSSLRPSSSSITTSSSKKSSDVDYDIYDF